MGCSMSSMPMYVNTKHENVIKIFPPFSSLPGSEVSEKKLKRARMTENDWIILTNRPDVVEKDIIKLLDWFIKEGILLNFLP